MKYLGAGAIGSVVLAIDHSTEVSDENHQVALKSFNPEYVYYWQFIEKMYHLHNNLSNACVLCINFRI